MHGSILVVTDSESFERGDYYCPFEDYELMQMIPGCDGVVSDQKPDEFLDTLDSVNMVYDEGTVKPSKLRVDGEELLVGVLDTKRLHRELMEEKKKRIEAVAEEIKREDPDMWRIAQDAYTGSAVYFVYAPEALFMGEMDMVLHLDPEKVLYVTETYDYHC